MNPERTKKIGQDRLPTPHSEAETMQVGGMADVVTALGRAVKEAGHNVKIIIPKYDVINYAEVSHQPMHVLLS